MCFDRVLATIQNLHGTRQFADSLIKLHGRRVSQITTYQMALSYMMGDLRFSPIPSRQIVGSNRPRNLMRDLEIDALLRYTSRGKMNKKVRVL